MTEQEIRAIIVQEVNRMIKEMPTFDSRELYIFSKGSVFLNGQNVQFGTINGTKLGTGTNQKLAFYNKTPIAQSAFIASPSGGGAAGVDAPARSAIDSIRTVLINLGLIASS